MRSGVDSSDAAVQLATDNAALNGLGADVASFVRADVSDYMREAVQKVREGWVGAAAGRVSSTAAGACSTCAAGRRRRRRREWVCAFVDR